MEGKLIVVAIVTFLLSPFSFSQEDFTHFKVNPSLYQSYPKFNPADKSNRGLPPLLEKVWSKIKDKVIDAANDLTDEILEHREDYDLGDSNFPGFNWRRLYGNIGISAGRTVEPINDDQSIWLVKDKLEIEVEARTFLKSLADNGQIDISDVNLKAFAGVVFKRTYHYSHYADSYFNGLKSSFKKLFLSFFKFQGENYLKLSPHEVIRKDDYISARLNADITSPSVYYISASGKIAIAYSKLGSLTVHRPGERDFPREDELLRMSINRSSFLYGSVGASVQADFYKLIKITLLSTEYSYSINKNYQLNLSFSQSDRERLTKDDDLRNEIQDVLKSKVPYNDDLLLPYIVSEQEGKIARERLDSQLLLWNKHVGNFNEEVAVRVGSERRYFNRHRTESTKIKKTLLGGIFNPKDPNNYKTRLTEHMNLEYELNEDQREIPLKNLSLMVPLNATVRFSKEFAAKKNSKAVRAYVRKFVDRYQSISNDVINAITDQELLPPYSINFNSQISKAGLNDFILTATDHFSETIEFICAYKEKCVKKIKALHQIVHHNAKEKGEIKLINLRNLLKELSKNSLELATFRSLFGYDHTHISGTFKSTTKNKYDYKSFIKEGLKQGYGLIKDYLKDLI